MSHKSHTLYSKAPHSIGARYILGNSAVVAEIESLADAVHGPNGTVATSLEAQGFVTPETDCDCDDCAASRTARESIRTGVTEGEETGDSDGNAPMRTITVRRTPPTMTAGLKLRTLPGTHWHDAWINACNASRSALTRKSKPVHGRKWTDTDWDACASDIYSHVWRSEMDAARVTGVTADRGTSDARFLRSDRVTVARFIGDATNWARDYSTRTVNERRALAETASLSQETEDGPETRDHRDREMRRDLPTNPIVRKAVLMADAVETASAMHSALGLSADRAGRAVAYCAAREADGATIAAIAAELGAKPATLRQWTKRATDRLPSAVNGYCGDAVLSPAPVTVTEESREEATRWHRAQHAHAESLNVPTYGIGKRASATRVNDANALEGYWRGAGAPMPDAAQCTFRIDPSAKTARRVMTPKRMPEWARESCATHLDRDGNRRPMPGARLHSARRLAAMSAARMARATKRPASERKALRSAAGVVA